MTLLIVTIAAAALSWVFAVVAIIGTRRARRRVADLRSALARPARPPHLCNDCRINVTVWDKHNADALALTRVTRSPLAELRKRGAL